MIVTNFWFVHYQIVAIVFINLLTADTFLYIWYLQPFGPLVQSVLIQIKTYKLLNVYLKYLLRAVFIFFYFK